MALTYFAPGLNLMSRVLESYDLNADSILRDVGIDPAVLADFNQRIPSQQLYAFLQASAAHIPNPNFALEVGQYWHPTQMGALGYAWMTSSTLRSALERLARFANIVIGTVNVSVKSTKKGVILILDFAHEDFAPDFRIDGAMTVVLAMLQCNAGADYHPQSISFRRAEPENASDFDALFQCPISFNGTTDSLTISLADADKPRACSNSQLAQLNDQLLIKYVAKLNTDNIAEKVKLSIIKALGSGYISESIVANSLLMSERTLQRRLHENKTSFKTLLNEVRQDLADKYLHDNNLSLTEVAYMLGFSEMSAFSRAYKRWSGQSPSNYRVAH